jgi:hypothetical protein
MSHLRHSSFAFQKAAAAMGRVIGTTADLMPEAFARNSIHARKKAQASRL